MNDELAAFQKHGISASYHYADDSGREWGTGHLEKDKALKIFDQNPDLQDEMREISKGFLWLLRIDRPEKT